MKNLLLLFLILIFKNIVAQNNTYTQAELDIINSLKVARSTNLDTAIIIAKQLKNIGIKKNKYNLIGISYRLLADAHGNFGNPSKAITNYENAKKSLIKAKDTLALADCYNNYSGVLKDMGNTNNAVTAAFNALNLYESLFKSHQKDSSYYFLTAYALNQIAISFMNNNNEYKAIPYLKKSARIHLLAGNINNAYRNYINLASCYESLEKLDTALIYYMLAIPYFEKNDDTEALLISYNNIGNLYDIKNDIKKAKIYYEKALKLSEINNNERQIIQSLFNLSALNIKDKNYNAAAIKLEKAKTIAESTNALDFLKRIYGNLSNMYAFKNNYDQFALNQNKFDSISTILSNEQSLKSLFEAEKKFETEKKDLLIKTQLGNLELAETKNKQKNYLLYGGSIILMLISFLGIIAYRNFRKTQVANNIIQLQNTKLEDSNREITLQKNELTEKNKEIMESITYSKYLQTAILPKANEFSKVSEINFLKYQPKDVISGDYYWIYSPSNNLTIWSTMDCTGHGVPGAMMSMLGISLLNEIVIENKIYKPSEILNKMRDKLITVLNQNNNVELNDGMDGTICMLDKTTNILSYASANGSLWVYRNNEFIELDYNKMPIGKHPVMNPFNNFEFIVQKNDWIIGLTDGLADQFGGLFNKKMKNKGIKTFLSTQLNDLTTTNIDTDLDLFYNNWKGMNEQTDDVTIIGIKLV